MVGLGTERPEGAGNKDMSALNTPYNGVTLRHGPSPGRDVLYQVVVQCTERSNRAISKLNQFQEQRHNDPTYFGLVSEDEAEEPALVNPELLDWRPMQEGMMSSSTEMGIQEPRCMESRGPGPEGVPTETSQLLADQWKDTMSKALDKEGDPAETLLAKKNLVVDFSSLGPVYQFDEVSQNEHVLDLTQLLAAILHMAHGLMYIPLSLLTTLSLNRI